MTLPHQAPPVQRTAKLETKARPQGVQPQLTCQCRDVNGTRTIWCVVGRSFYDTGQKC